MIYVGIDIAKLNHFASAISSDGVELMMQDSYRFVSFYDLDPMDLKQLGRFRQKTIKQRARLKIHLTSYVDQVFPELQYFFKSGLLRKLSTHF